MLDRDQNDILDPAEMAMYYNAARDPDVRNTSVPDHLDPVTNFFQYFDCIEVDGIVTREEFEQYYRNVSASIDDDKKFEDMLRDSWPYVEKISPNRPVGRSWNRLTHNEGLSEARGGVASFPASSSTALTSLGHRSGQGSLERHANIHYGLAENRRSLFSSDGSQKPVCKQRARVEFADGSPARTVEVNATQPRWDDVEFGGNNLNRWDHVESRGKGATSSGVRLEGSPGNVMKKGATVRSSTANDEGKVIDLDKARQQVYVKWKRLGITEWCSEAHLLVMPEGLSLRQQLERQGIKNIANARLLSDNM